MINLPSRFTFYNMGIVRLLKPALFVYECIRILLLAFFVVFQPIDPAGLPRFVFLAPGVLFPLMALFIWVDTPRYRAYLPLFTAGKCIGILALLGWSIISRSLAALSNTDAIEAVLLYGDIFALSAVLWILRNEGTSKSQNEVIKVPPEQSKTQSEGGM